MDKIVKGFPLRRCSWAFDPIVTDALGHGMIRWLDKVCLRVYVRPNDSKRITPRADRPAAQNHCKVSMKGSTEMELDRALELAVVSAWDELIPTDGPCCIHVEYKTGSGRALRLVEVWTIGNTGYGTLAFRYRAARSESSAKRLEDRTMRFGNSYRSDILASNFDFIMKNQGDFTKPLDRSIHGGIQIETPTAEDRKSAAAWKRSIQKRSPQTHARAGLGLE